MEPVLLAPTITPTKFSTVATTWKTLYIIESLYKQLNAYREGFLSRKLGLDVELRLTYD